MKKIIPIIFCVVIVLVVAVTFFVYSQSQKPLDPTKVSDSQIISMLRKNSNAQYYMGNHSDFLISKKQILTREDIINGQNGANFREVYLGLKLEDSRYMTVNLMNPAANNGLVAVIDFKKNEVLRAYGIMLYKSNAVQNGQINIPAENK